MATVGYAFVVLVLAVTSAFVLLDRPMNCTALSEHQQVYVVSIGWGYER